MIVIGHNFTLWPRAAIGGARIKGADMLKTSTPLAQSHGSISMDSFAELQLLITSRTVGLFILVTADQAHLVCTLDPQAVAEMPLKPSGTGALSWVSRAGQTTLPFQRGQGQPVKGR